MYRGTGGTGSGSKSWGDGEYFATTEKAAKIYGPNIETRSSLKNPLEFSYKNFDDLQASKASLAKKAKELGVFTGEFSDDLTAVAKAEGKDGIRVVGQGVEVHFGKE